MLLEYSEKKKRLLGLICIRDDYRSRDGRVGNKEREREGENKSCFDSLENWLKFKRMKLR